VVAVAVALAVGAVDRVAVGVVAVVVSLLVNVAVAVAMEWFVSLACASLTPVVRLVAYDVVNGPSFVTAWGVGWPVALLVCWRCVSWSTGGVFGSACLLRASVFGAGVALVVVPSVLVWTSLRVQVVSVVL